MSISELDQQQILQNCYDKETKRLRVLSDLEIVSENLEIPISPNKFSVSDFSQYIGTTSTQILGVNPNRSFLCIQNSSNKKVWIEFNSPAVVGFPSMVLNPNQTLFQESMSIMVDSIYAISDSENVPLIIKEG